MKRVLLAASLTVVLSVHAWAWDGTNTGPGQLVEQGSANQATSHAVSNSHASAASSSLATGGRSTATGGRSSATGGTVNVNGAGGSGGGGAAFLAVPSASAAGGVDCPVIGPGIGGQSGLAAGVFSWGYISPDCNKRRTAMELMEIEGPDVARAYMEQQIAGVKEAVEAARATAKPTQPVSSNTKKIYPYDYCETRNHGDRNQHLECNKGVLVQ